MTKEFKTFADMMTALPTDAACREYLEMKRWNGVPSCPHCGTVDTNHYKLRVKGEFKGMYKCKACKERFTVTVGTMFEGSPIPMRKWFIASYIFSAHKKGISSHQLSRDLGVTQKTAWFMLHRLRLSFTDNDDCQMGGGGSIVEADSTVIGGKVKNMSNKKRKAIADGYKMDKTNPLRNANKTTVAAFVERAASIRFDVIDKNEKEHELLKKHVDTGSVLMTDSAYGFRGVGKEYAFHGVVDHSKSEYCKDEVIHTNTIEGAFSLLDRMITGIYHHVSPKHLQAYCHESAFRYNSRKVTDKQRFDLALVKTNGVRLYYEDLIAAKS